MVQALDLNLKKRPKKEFKILQFSVLCTCDIILPVVEAAGKTKSKKEVVTTLILYVGVITN